MYSPPGPQPSHADPQPPSVPYFAANPAPSYPPAAAVPHPASAPAIDARAHARTRAGTAGIALLAATGVMLVAAITKSWFTAGHDSGVGLIGLESCRGAMCRSVTWFDVRRVPTQIPIFATTALIACACAIALAIHAGIMLVQNRPEAVKLRGLGQLLGLAASGMVAFVFSLSIGEWSRGLSLGWSAFAGLGGLAAAALVTAILVRPLVSGGLR